MRAPLFAAVLVACAACPVAPQGECAAPADCAPAEDAPCDGCPPVAVELCRAGACVAPETPAVDVVADVNVDRDAAAPARLVHVVADGAPCAELLVDGALASSANVLAAGDKALSGGTFHPDVALGRVPEGPVSVVVLVDDAAGARVAAGCADGLQAAAPTLDVGVLEAPAR